MAVCSLSDIPSFITCTQASLPFGEGVSVAIFLIFFLLFKEYPLREALPSALFAELFTAAVFYGLGAMNPQFLLGSVIALALSVVFLNSQNSY